MQRLSTNPQPTKRRSAKSPPCVLACQQPPPGRALKPAARQLVHRHHRIQVGFGVRLVLPLLDEAHNVQPLPTQQRVGGDVGAAHRRAAHLCHGAC